jgi:hypothetical protein
MLSLTDKQRTHFSNCLEVTGWLQVVDTMALRFTIGATLGNWALATTTTNSDTVDDES